MKTVCKVLVLGATGMLGNAVLRFFVASPGFDVWGSARSTSLIARLPEEVRTRVYTGIDVENSDQLAGLLDRVRPNVVINCIGLVKQLAQSEDPLAALPLNSLLPHRLVRLTRLVGARLIHVSTDCVFLGTRGQYHEADAPDATELYGRSKLLGEVEGDNSVTLRTSIIGHELGQPQGLVGWFLAQQGSVRGFTQAIFSGLPTVELARVIRDFVIPYPELTGTYHVSADPISKFELLSLVANAYSKDVAITPDDKLVIDRSLDSSRFQQTTGYAPPSWPDLVAQMRDFG